MCQIVIAWNELGRLQGSRAAGKSRGVGREGFTVPTSAHGQDGLDSFRDAGCKIRVSDSHRLGRHEADTAMTFRKQ